MVLMEEMCKIYPFVLEIVEESCKRRSHYLGLAYSQVLVYIIYIYIYICVYVYNII